MQIAVVGATGNVGTSVLRALADDPRVARVLGIARRVPPLKQPKTEFVAADIVHSKLEPLFEGMDAVIHLGWRIQSAHHPRQLELNNVRGSERVFDAVEGTGVPALLYSSSIGAYSPGPKDQLVSESFPRLGVPTSLYSTQKAKVERLLDELELRKPSLRVVRFRPALIFKRDAGTEIRRLFAASWIPRVLFSRRLLKVVPYNPRFCFQVVHSFDVGEAFRLALHSNERGAFNLAADPPLNSHIIAQALGAGVVPVSANVMRHAASISWHLRLQNSDPGWVDLCHQSPLIDSTRARTVLGWAPQRSGVSALLELLDGIRDGAGGSTPPLAPQRKAQASTG